MVAGDAHGKVPVFPVGDALFLWMYGQWVHDRILDKAATLHLDKIYPMGFHETHDCHP
jgi:hypothetical protein